MKNIFKENDVLYRRNNNLYVLKNSFDHTGIMDRVNDLENSYEDIHFFDGGKSSQLLNSQKIFQKSSNHFGIYDKNIYSLLKSIRESLKSICYHYEINYARMFYYISSMYQKEVSTEYWYDTGGIRIPCFSGMAFLDDVDNMEITIGDTKVTVSSGDFILFEAGHKIVYSKSNTNMISFNIAPLDMLSGQYPQKWIPVL